MTRPLTPGRACVAAGPDRSNSREIGEPERQRGGGGRVVCRYQDSSAGSEQEVAVPNGAGCAAVWENGGLNPSASVLRLSLQAGFSPRRLIREQGWAFRHIYNPNTHTHALLNSGGLQLGELQSGFLLSRSVPLLCFHCPRLSTAPLGPGCQSRAFDETVSAICLAEHKRICEQERAEEGRGKSRRRGRMAALACARD